MRTRSPFPGMDPWLEGYWGDVHTRLITTFADQIQEQLPGELYDEIEVTVYIADEGGDRGNAIPDVALLGSAPAWSNQPAISAGSDIAVASPYRIQIPPEPVEQKHVVIRSLKDHNNVVTVIEVLSPTNKSDRRARRAYLDKREEYYNARVNVVEIDLLRAGADLIDVPFDELPDRLLTAYKAVVRRGRRQDNTEAEYYALPLREPLPRIAIPLRRSDADVILDMQKAIDQAYSRGRYGTRLNYGKPPLPSLAEDDAQWAADLIAKSR